MATAQEQEALNEVMQLLEATPDTAEPTGFTPGLLLTTSPPNARSWPSLFRLASLKRPLVCRSHTNRSNA